MYQFRFVILVLLVQLHFCAMIVLTQSEYQLTVLALTNNIRRLNGVSPICLQQNLNDAAQMHSNDMARNRFHEHQGSDGSSPFDRMRQVGYIYTTASENIAFGSTNIKFDDPNSVVEAWRTSQGHFNNIINGNVQHMGVAMTVGKCIGIESDCAYWTQVFGASNLECMSNNAAINTLSNIVSVNNPSIIVPVTTPSSPVIPISTPNTANPTSNVPTHSSPTGIVTAPSAVPYSSVVVDPRIIKILNMMNDTFGKNKRQKMCLERRLMKVAQQKANRMARTRSLSKPGNANLIQNVQAAGYLVSRVTEASAVGSGAGIRSIGRSLNNCFTSQNGRKLINTSMHAGISVVTGACPNNTGTCSYWSVIIASPARGNTANCIKVR